MHGRKKTLEPQSEAELSVMSKKAATYSTLVELLIRRRQASDASLETLDLNGKLLKSNPDYYSLWNYRREILLTMHAEIGLRKRLADQPGGQKLLGSSNDAIAAVRDQELRLTADAIQKNSKSCK